MTMTKGVAVEDPDLRTGVNYDHISTECYEVHGT